MSAATTTPLDVIKTRMMLGCDSVGVRYRNMTDTVARIYGVNCVHVCAPMRVGVRLCGVFCFVYVQGGKKKNVPGKKKMCLVLYCCKGAAKRAMGVGRGDPSVGASAGLLSSGPSLEAPCTYIHTHTHTHTHTYIRT